MSELGRTSDPRMLVPGDPEAVSADAAALRGRAKSAGDAGNGLRSIDTGAWTGAAAARFRDKFGYEPGRWFTAADAMQAGAGALDDYAATLRWAREQAGEAVRLWNQGQALTSEAQGTAVPPLSDPGDDFRSAAVGTLENARAQVRSAASVAARTLRAKAELAPEKSGWLDELGDALHDAGAHVVNGVASFGTAMVNNPGSVALAAAGAGLALLSAGGGGTGVALSATGVGAVAGVPLSVVSAAGLATGAGITTAAVGNLAVQASGEDRVTPMETRGDAASSGVADSTAGNPAGVKPGWSSRPADNGQGTVYQKPGSAGNADMVRVMEPTPRYPDGYVRFYNQHGQPVGLDGKPGPNPATHIPIRPDGSYPVPQGW
ncbi:putative T7SS-secreted protein [Actinoplanes sp. NPDC023936]|uniref:putative T7SS-secreted protein n=1 Tax=Actinoplanes sp. NPDC023936 TaxID=3154910 RepID=UPI0033E0BDA4